MLLILTVKELVDLGYWEKWCKVTGNNPKSIEMGLRLPADKITIPWDEVKKIRLHKKLAKL